MKDPYCLIAQNRFYQLMASRRVWTEQEDKAISELVRQHGQKNWALVATHLSKELGLKPRSGKQCRERWHNHLDPTIQKKIWSKPEEERLFELHRLHGNKWTVIAQSLPGRTDNSIKNYFYSTIRRSLRRMGKFVGSKNSTEQMKKIKPSTLSKIFAAGQQLAPNEGQTPEQTKLIAYIQSNCESVRDEIIQFTNYKPKRSDQANTADRGKYEQVIEKMVHINQIYEKVKGEEKKRRHDELVFQKDYHRILQSDSEEEMDEEPSSGSEVKVPQMQNLSTRTRKNIKMPERTALQVDYKKEDSLVKDNEGNPMMPTVIVRTQANLQAQPQEEEQFQNPQFFIELKEEEYQTAGIAQIGRSPGYYFNTPSINPFSFFQSPSSPRHAETYYIPPTLGGLQNHTIDEFQVSIQREIEGNLNHQRKSGSTLTSIGSPGSAFRYCLP